MKLFARSIPAKKRSVLPPSSELGAFTKKLLAELVRDFPIKESVDLVWKNLRVSAGRATYQLNHISLSRTLLIDEERIERTLKHEYAHLLAYSRHGKRGMGHGDAWKQAMRDLGEEPIVRHNYEVERNVRRQLVTYECVHCRARIQRRRRLPRRRKYVHASCGGPLKFVSIEQVSP